LNSKAADILEIPQDARQTPDTLEGLVVPEERGRLAEVQSAWRKGESREIECRIIGSHSGREKTLLVSGTPASNSAQQDGGFLLSILDITERKKSAALIEHLSHHDTLTGLPNRNLFQDRLRQAMAFATRGRKRNALLVLDLDNFKDINDTLGHRAGDRLLQMVATRLTHCTRQIDTVARLGGNEFAIVCTELGHGNLVQHMAERIMEAMAKPFQIDDETIRTSSTIGIALFPHDTDDADQLIKFADMALYQAKAAGRNHYQFFDASMDEAVRRRKGLEADLRQAIENEAFTLLYQPQLRLSDGVIYGAEALVRWNHPDRGMISPADFIPLAESTGLIRELGHWVLRTACQQASTWAEAGHPNIRMAVNLSAVEFMSDKLLRNVRAALDESGLPAQQLELEITESAVMADMEKAIAAMQGLREIGTRLAIDDFGTGFSSLAYLKRFPVQALKIDRSFVQEILLSTEDAAIAAAVISLGKSLNLEVIAEGVEEAEQAEHLRQAGCPFAQGYYFGRPVPADEFFTQPAAKF
jgi:diguanylate cyclase (GGDEF)-like protein